MATETPIPIALLLADDVYQDAFTGKWVISGVFSAIGTTTLPATHDKLVVFWQMTGVSAPVDLRLRIEHADAGEPIFELAGPISAKSPLDVISVPIPIRQIRFEKAGKYWIQLLSGEEILIQSPLQVTLIEQQPPSVRIGKDSP